MARGCIFDGWGGGGRLGAKRVKSGDMSVYHSVAIHWKGFGQNAKPTVFARA